MNSSAGVPQGKRQWSRRGFLTAASTMAAAAGVPRQAAPAKSGSVWLVVDSADEVAASSPATWALQHLTRVLQARGIAVIRHDSGSPLSNSGLVIFATSAKSAIAVRMLADAGVTVADAPEALAIVSVKHAGGAALLVCGHDARGLVYALTEIADIVENSSEPMQDLLRVQTTSERPANQVRSMTRLFCSEVEDKPWFNDREMWPQYFDLLAAQRFNRFNLAFGIGYDFIRKVTDAYFLFTYPFLLKVPGYSVRVPQLSDEERDRNLQMLRYISEQCVMRGLEFHVGLWMHGYVWINSPDANYTIEGLDKTTHGAYCRDAVRLLLQEVPDIQGLTFRIHGESGVEEGSFEFWKTVFDGVKTCGRRIQLDMHTKGMSQQMIEIALSTDQPLQMSPKFWGEHMGMPYHQADIRELEKPKAHDEKGLMALSTGTRAFLRYGYGDLLPEDRRWTVVHRIWPGTQRVLLWGDPVFASGYSRAFSFCSSSGVEIQEMLSFKGRRGSGHAGDRCAYLDRSYSVRWDWEKYEYGTRVWGRMLYDPGTHAEVPGRLLVKQFGPGAVAMQAAIANVSRILPIITTAHAPSAGNNTYWPELYFNQSMIDAEHFGPYGDSPQPRVFGKTSPLDPELFYTVDDFADDLLVNRSNGKLSPVEVARWVETFAAAGRRALSQAEISSTGKGTGAYRRAKIDVLIQAGLGEFFAAKLRSGVLFRIYEKTKDASALQASINQYTKARDTWATLATVATGVYMTDITLGEEPQLRGHWADRLPAMNKDIAALVALQTSSQRSAASPTAGDAIAKVLHSASRAMPLVQHQPPGSFKRAQALPLAASVPTATTRVLLHYRHVDQAENYRTVPMEKAEGRHAAAIPAEYTQTEFPLEYFFELTAADGSTVLFPGFTPSLNNQPYFTVRSVRT